ncbi:MAG: nucleotidyltransferase domain-containing protein [Candidatus Wallbacteria bacterium]|nr:nucleotidyltransferase domain-containing protein [Candidatus Wallbacteria bacterium]
MAGISAEIIDRVVRFKELASRVIQIRKAIVFGSYAKGCQREESDIDVCIISDNVTNNFLALQSIMPFVVDVDYRIEPVVFSYAEYISQENLGVLGEVKRYGIEV